MGRKRGNLESDITNRASPLLKFSLFIRSLGCSVAETFFHSFILLPLSRYCSLRQPAQKPVSQLRARRPSRAVRRLLCWCCVSTFFASRFSSKGRDFLARNRGGEIRSVSDFGLWGRLPCGIHTYSVAWFGR